MAFRRKDVKKASYYVWFLGARESAGLRGEQYILPVLAQLLRQERLREPVKVTLQVSSKGLKIVQNVCRSKESKPAQVKHVIPAASITCALQSEDVVSVVLLLFNPLTGCPVHVHAYRCDSLATAFGLRSQLQTLIERPENQRKFAEIEARLAAKGLLSEQYLNKHLLRSGSANALESKSKKKSSPAVTALSCAISSATTLAPQAISGSSSATRYAAADTNRMSANLTTMKETSFGRPSVQSTRNISSSSSSSNQHTLNSDGRSAVDDEESSQDTLDSNHSDRDARSPVDPMVAVMYESLAAELKAKLGNPEVAPILLPPRDYDTVCRSRGQVTERTDRKCTNRLLVGGPTIEKSINSKSSKTKASIVAAQSNEAKTLSIAKLQSVVEKSAKVQSAPVQPQSATTVSTASSSTEQQLVPPNKQKEPVKPPRNRGPASLAQQEAGCEEIIQKTDQVRKTTKNMALPVYDSTNEPASDQLKSCAQVQVHSQVRLERLRAEKAKVAAKLEQLEQMEQLERATAESARKHAINQLNRTASAVDGKVNKSTSSATSPTSSKSISKSNTHSKSDQSSRTTTNEPLNPKLITQHHGLKQIGSSLAAKIRQTLFVSGGGSSGKCGLTGKQSPQLIRHQMLHSSQPDLRVGNELQTATSLNNKTQTLQQPITLSDLSEQAERYKADASCETNDGKRSSSASSGKSASSGIGSSRLAINGFEDDLEFGSCTDEELDLEMLRRGDSQTSAESGGSGGSGRDTNQGNTIIEGGNGNEWRSRRAAVRSMSNLVLNSSLPTNRTNASHTAKRSPTAFDEGLDDEEDDDEDEYFINDSLELEERPLKRIIGRNEPHVTSPICYDQHRMTQMEQANPMHSNRRRAASVESVVQLGCKSSSSKAVRDLDDVDLLQHVESLPPVSRQACLRRSETSVGVGPIEPSPSLSQPQATALSNPKRHSSAASSQHHKQRVVVPACPLPASHSSSSFYYPHVPNDPRSSSSARHPPSSSSSSLFPVSMLRADASDLKRQASTPSLLHSPHRPLSTSRAVPNHHHPLSFYPSNYPTPTHSQQQHHNRHAFAGSRSAISNTQLHLLPVSQPFRLRSKPLQHGFVNGF